jgi:hypothetical protein
VEQIHRVDDQCDIRCVLAGRICELLLGNDRVLCKNVCPGLRSCPREVAIDATDARFADGGDLRKQTIGDLCRGVIGIDQHG